MVNGPERGLRRGGVACFVALLAACGGRSIRHGDDDDAAAQGGSSGQSSSSSTGGLSGGATVTQLDQMCLDVCARGRAQGCTGYDARVCDDSCHAIDAIAAQTATCANTLYTYMNCLDHVANLCNIDILKVCDGGSNAVNGCISGFCSAHPTDPNCPQ